ncbi:replication initiator protein A [Fusobacterium sp. PH5-44]|uniref:replication initiator protein A n=1 Tax=unclassified Fusobacterium TaxID=2648384 RepID=UPI003D1B7915
MEEKLYNSEVNDIELVESITIRETGSLIDDIQKMDIRVNEVPDVELKEIVIRETGNFLNLRESVVNIPVEMIVFPFFTYQKQNKRVNFEYNFKDLGIKMQSTIILNNKSDKVFQPSTFEEKIYTFLIYQYEVQSVSGDKSEYIEFEISDFIVNFLGNKMNRTYYTKVEQGLKNLKNTQYQFTVDGYSKLGRYEFEDMSFKLLEYNSLKIGRKRYYRVFLNRNIRKKIEDKRYIIYNTKSLLEILTKDAIASRIYRYISKIRYKKTQDEINIRTLAAIIPLKTEQIAERITKDGKRKNYYLSRIKQVLKRIEKAFDALIELGYILEYNSRYVKEEDTYFISYVFNPQKDGKCHISEFINNNNIEKIEDKRKKIEEIEDVEVNDDYNKMSVVHISVNKATVKSKDKFLFPDDIQKDINIVMRNPHINKAWNKRVEKKFVKLYEDNEKETLKYILNKLKNQNTPIRTTLVAYINWLMKRTEESSNLTLFDDFLVSSDVENKKDILFDEQKDIKNIKEELEEKLAEKEKNIQKETQLKNKIFENMTTSEIDNIIEKSKALYLSEENGIASGFLDNFSLNNSLYFGMLYPYIMKVINNSKEENNK